MRGASEKHFSTQPEQCRLERMYHTKAGGKCRITEDKTLEFRYDTQLLIEGNHLDETEINEYFTDHFHGDCLLVVGDEELIKIHFHTNEPWKVLEYCSSLGEIYDIVIEDMARQARGQKG